MKPPERVMIQFDGIPYEYRLHVKKTEPKIQQPKTEVPEIKNLKKTEIKYDNTEKISVCNN